MTLMLMMLLLMSMLMMRTHCDVSAEAARVFPTHSGPCYSRARPIYNFLMKPLSIDQTNTAGPDNAH